MPRSMLVTQVIGLTVYTRTRDELQNKTLRRNRAVAGHGLYDARRRQSQVTTISTNSALARQAPRV